MNLRSQQGSLQRSIVGPREKSELDAGLSKEEHAGRKPDLMVPLSGSALTERIGL